MADRISDVPVGTEPSGRALAQLLNALSNLKFTVVAGAAADTNILITGMVYADDTVVSVLQFDVAAGHIDNLVDLTSEVKAGSVASAIQLETANTTGDVLLVVWFNSSAALT